MCVPDLSMGLSLKSEGGYSMSMIYIAINCFKAKKTCRFKKLFFIWQAAHGGLNEMKCGAELLEHVYQCKSVTGASAWKYIP